MPTPAPSENAETALATEPFEVRNRWTGRVQFTAQIALNIPLIGLKIGAAVKWARDSRAVLSGADLSGADLRGADLSGAVLSGADLRGAVLSGADLSGAVLRGAVLSGAVLRRADLSGADLRGADLSGAVLRRADLRPIRADLFDVLVSNRDEAPAFLAALRAGRVDGSTYHGECACLVGTIANTRGVSPDVISGIDSSRPIERFVLGIKQGDTPETNPVAALVAEWTEQFIGSAPTAGVTEAA